MLFALRSALPSVSSPVVTQVTSPLAPPSASLTAGRHCGEKLLFFFLLLLFLAGVSSSAVQAQTAGQVRYFPRAGWESRMTGGLFQGSQDNSTWTTLYTVPSAPGDAYVTAVLTTDPRTFRYLRYLAPSSSYGNVAEIEFDSVIGGSVVKLTGTKFGTAGSYNNDGNVYTNALDGSTSTFFNAPSPGNGDYVGIDQGAPPTGLAGRPSNGSVSLSWTAPSGTITGYNVYRGTASSGPFTKINSSTVTVTSYADAGLTNGTLYYYAVTALTAAGESGYSNQISVTAGADTTPPVPLSVTVHGNTGTLTWTETGSPPVLQAAQGVFTDTNAGIAADRGTFTYASGVDANGNKYVTNGQTGTSLRYGFYSPGSNEWQIGPTLLGGSQDYVGTPGQAPGTFPLTGWNITGSGSPAPIFTGFNANQGLSFSTTGGTAGQLSGGAVTISNVVTSGTTTTFTLSRTVANTETGTLSGAAGAFTDSASPPNATAAFSGLSVTILTTPAPTGLLTKAGSGGVGLNWVVVSGASGYNVYQGTASGGPFTQINTGAVPAATYTDSTGVNGMTYYYVVTALSASGGESPYSNVASAMAGSPVLAAPLLSAQAGTVYTNTGMASGINLSWTAVAGATQYDLYRSTTSGGEGMVPYKTNVAQNNSGTLSTTYSEAPSSGTYYYQAVAVGPGGEGALSNEASATVGATALTAPLLKGTTSGTQNALTWSVVPNATSYNLYRNIATSSYPGTLTLYKLGLTSTTFTDSGLTTGTMYTYYVTAVNTNGEGNHSSQVSLTVGSASLPAPSLTAKPSSGPGGGYATQLQWPSISGTSSYNLYRSTSAGGEGSVAYKTGIAQSTGTIAYNDGVNQSTGQGTLSSGVTYYYQVVAVGQAGEGAFSNEASATVGATPLTAPLLKGTTSGTQNALTWSVVPSATSYNLYRNNSLYQRGLTGTMLTDLGLTTGTTYSYYVTAVNTSGEGTQSSTVSLKVGATALAAPLLSAKSGAFVNGMSAAGVSLNWSAIMGATQYDLYRSTTPGGEGTVPYKTNIAQNNSGTLSTTYSEGLPSGSTYYYQVVAVGPGGEGTLSNEASVIPGTQPLAAPANVTATAAPNGGQSIAVSWNAVPTATSYNLYRVTSSNGSAFPGSESIYKQGLTSTSFTDTSVTYRTTYNYQVTAVNTSGEGGRSSQASAVLIGFGIVAAPTTITVARGTISVVTLSLTPSGGYMAPVLLSGTNLPAGVSAWFYPASVFLPTVNQPAEYAAGLPGEGILGTVSSGLYLAVSANAMPGTYTLNISGASGTFTSGTTVTVTIQ